MEWNWLTIAVAGVFLLGFLIGIYRGAIRIAVSLATTILTIVIVVAASPYVSSAIEKHTPIDDMIKSQVTNTMAKAAASQLTGGSDDSGSTGISAESVRKALKAAGISEEELQSYGVSVDDIVNGKITGEQLAQYGISSSILDGVNNDEVSEEVKNAIEGADIPRDLQVAAIEKADLPAVFKTQLSTNNNSEIYSQLGVQTFAQYVGEFLSKLIIHIIAFLGTFLIVTIILRAIVFALDIVAELPVLGFINRLAGGVVGLGCALIIVWVAFIIITMLYMTSIGKEAYELIDNTCSEMMASGDSFRQYLDVQGRFDRYSVANAILVSAQMPEATQLKEYSKWKANRVYVNKDAQKIIILEPSKEYTREDGTKGISYNAKVVYDISETSAKDRQQEQEPKSMRELVSALIDASPVSCVPVGELELPAYYDSSQQTIFVKKGLSEEVLFVSMAKEVSAAVYDFKHNESRDASDFKSFCVAYMVSSRYGVDTRGFDFSRLPREYAEMDTQAFKGELGTMRDVLGEIQSDMYKSMEKNKPAKNKEQER